MLPFFSISSPMFRCCSHSHSGKKLIFFIVIEKNLTRIKAVSYWGPDFNFKIIRFFIFEGPESRGT